MPSPPIRTRGALVAASCLHARVATASSDARSALVISTRPSIMIRNSRALRCRSSSSPSVVATVASTFHGTMLKAEPTLVHSNARILPTWLEVTTRPSYLLGPPEGLDDSRKVLWCHQSSAQQARELLLGGRPDRPDA